MSPIPSYPPPWAELTDAGDYPSGRQRSPGKHVMSSRRIRAATLPGKMTLSITTRALNTFRRAVFLLASTPGKSEVSPFRAQWRRHASGVLGRSLAPGERHRALTFAASGEQAWVEGGQREGRAAE